MGLINQQALDLSTPPCSLTALRPAVVNTVGLSTRNVGRFPINPGERGAPWETQAEVGVEALGYGGSKLFCTAEQIPFEPLYPKATAPISRRQMHGNHFGSESALDTPPTQI